VQSRYDPIQELNQVHLPRHRAEEMKDVFNFTMNGRMPEPRTATHNVKHSTSRHWNPSGGNNSQAITKIPSRARPFESISLLENS
jgi:hypothetical protein